MQSAGAARSVPALCEAIHTTIKRSATGPQCRRGGADKSRSVWHSGRVRLRHTAQRADMALATAQQRTAVTGASHALHQRLPDGARLPVAAAQRCRPQFVARHRPATRPGAVIAQASRWAQLCGRCHIALIDRSYHGGCAQVCVAAHAFAFEGLYIVKRMPGCGGSACHNRT
jgi:hypothetical protein